MLKAKSTSNLYKINIVALRDIQTNNVAQNDNQVSNSETNQCNGELHKPLLTLNEPLQQNADPIAKDIEPATTYSGRPKTPEHFLSLPNSIKAYYALNQPALMRELRRQGLDWDEFEI